MGEWKRKGRDKGEGKRKVRREEEGEQRRGWGVRKKKGKEKGSREEERVGVRPGVQKCQTRIAQF